MGAAAALALTMAHDNPLLQAVLGGADGDHGLLPLLTTRGEPAAQRGVELFGAWYAGALPTGAPAVGGARRERRPAPRQPRGRPHRDVAAAADDLALLVRRLLR